MDVVFDLGALAAPVVSAVVVWFRGKRRMKSEMDDAIQRLTAVGVRLRREIGTEVRDADAAVHKITTGIVADSEGRLRSDVVSGNEELRAELHEMREQFGSELRSAVGEVKGEVGGVRIRLGELDSHVTEVRGQMGDLSGRVDGLKNGIGVAAAALKRAGDR